MNKNSGELLEKLPSNSHLKFYDKVTSYFCLHRNILYPLFSKTLLGECHLTNLYKIVIFISHVIYSVYLLLVLTYRVICFKWVSFVNFVAMEAYFLQFSMLFL